MSRDASRDAAGGSAPTSLRLGRLGRRGSVILISPQTMLRRAWAHLLILGTASGCGLMFVMGQGRVIAELGLGLGALLFAGGGSAANSDVADVTFDPPADGVGSSQI